MSSNYNFSLPVNKLGSTTDIRAVRMRVKHVLHEGSTIYVLYAQDDSNRVWKTFSDFPSFLDWLSTYRGVVLEETSKYTLIEMPIIVDVHSIPKKFFEAITEPKDLVWTMRRVHSSYIARMDKFEIVPGTTHFIGNTIYCMRIFLYRKQETVPYCVIRVIHDYLETDEGLSYI